MDEMLMSLQTVSSMGIEQVVCSLLISLVLSSIIATTYIHTFQGLSYSRSFIHTMILGSVVVCMLIMAIGNNLARGLGILGTLAIIRFRSPIRDPRDMIFLFASFGIGIGSGAGTYTVSLIGTIFISATAFILHWAPFASRREYEGLLRFTLPQNSGSEPAVAATLQECCSSAHMIAMREAAQGDFIEYSYQVRLIDPSYQSDLIEKLHAIEDLTDSNLLMQRTTVEL